MEGGEGRGEIGELLVVLVAGREVCGVQFRLARPELGYRLADLARELAASDRGEWMHTAADAGTGAAAPSPDGVDDGLGILERRRKLGPHRSRLRSSRNAA